MANNQETDAKQGAEALSRLIRSAEGSQAAGFRLLAGRQAKKVERQKAVEKRLSTELDENDPRLAAVRLKIRRKNEAALAYRQRSARLALQPEVGVESWVVTGHVRFPDGRPAVGYRVELFDRDRKFHDQLGSTKTNEFGDFHISYLESQFDDEFRKDGPDLFVNVLDKKGNSLIASDTPVRVNAGRVEHFDIVISEPPRKTSRK